MANPAKVQNFLDIAGLWDPSLAFVMGGAILVTSLGYVMIRRNAKPYFHDTFHFPTSRDIDYRLLTGAGIFGVGWGLGGYCPGPAITALPLTNLGTVVFVIAMLIGMSIARFILAPRVIGTTV